MSTSCCECCVLSGRGLCVGLIIRPEESYRVWCVWVWSWILDKQEALAQQGCCVKVKKIYTVPLPHMLIVLPISHSSIRPTDNYQHYIILIQP